jgi:hypothetical protein
VAAIDGELVFHYRMIFILHMVGLQKLLYFANNFLLKKWHWLKTQITGFYGGVLIKVIKDTTKV